MGFRLDLQAFAPACSYYCLIIGVLYQSIYFVTRCRAVLFAAAVLWVKSQYWLTFHGQSDILNIVNKGENAFEDSFSVQADGTWDFRNPDDKEKDKVAQPAYFPNKCVGIAGGAGGFDTNVDCQDTAINGDGSYTISIAQSGTVNAEAQKFDDGSTNEGWIWAANAVPVAPATSGTDSNSKKDDSKTDSKSDSKTDSKANSTAATTSSKTGTTGTTTATSSNAASDKTAATGATAGIALAGIALAGAAIVVSKRK